MAATVDGGSNLGSDRPDLATAAGGKQDPVRGDGSRMTVGPIGSQRWL